MKQRFVGAIFLFASSIATFSIATSSISAAEVDFEMEIRPILETACVHCHNAERAEGDLRLDSLQAAIEGGSNGTALVPGDAEASPLFTTTILPPDDDEFMPPESAPLSPWQTDRLKAWINEGAKWPEGEELKEQPRVDFVRSIQPILEVNCVSCHSGEEPEADYDITTSKMAFEGQAILPFWADESPVYTLTILETDDDGLMPPKGNGGPLPDREIALLKSWIDQGANWPTDVPLKVKARIPSKRNSPDNLGLIEKIHAKIVATHAEASKGEMANYVGTIPQTGVEFEMVAIPGGTFQMGSPDDEADRQAIEGPRRTVQVEPFWMGKHEVTWDEYEPFMINNVDRFKWGTRMDYDPEIHTIVDAVSQPTGPYTEMSFGMGQKGYPAISMTQHAANKYCQWLSAQTGHFYRLATEAEWEYACRAGTTTAYSFGDDSSQIGQYAWYYDNANEKYQKVGKKKPNPWGLHDMHGNVLEWTADQFLPDYFEQIEDGAKEPFMRPSKRYPRSVRGGSWYDDPESLRSAFRRGSDESWKMQDPQLPKSIWYHTNAKWLGFRIIRPQRIPSVEEMNFYWNSAVK